MKDLRNDVNRKVNCETANLNKTIEAAVMQIDAINFNMGYGHITLFSSYLFLLLKNKLRHYCVKNYYFPFFISSAIST